MPIFKRKKLVTTEGSNLGNILLKMGAVSEEQLEASAEAQKSSEDVHLGEVLVQAGLISREDLKEALSLQGQMRNGKALDAMFKMVEEKSNRVDWSGMKRKPLNV